VRDGVVLEDWSKKTAHDEERELRLYGQHKRKGRPCPNPDCKNNSIVIGRFKQPRMLFEQLEPCRYCDGLNGIVRDNDGEITGGKITRRCFVCVVRDELKGLCCDCAKRYGSFARIAWQKIIQQNETRNPRVFHEAKVTVGDKDSSILQTVYDCTYNGRVWTKCIFKESFALGKNRELVILTDGYFAIVTRQPANPEIPLTEAMQLRIADAATQALDKAKAAQEKRAAKQKVCA
jgi:hypothetical protein